MKFTSTRRTLFTVIAGLALVATGMGNHAHAQGIEVSKLGTYTTGVFAEGAAEIVAYDPDTKRLFVVNAQAATVDVLDISDPTDPALENTIDVTNYGAVANSVAVHNGVVAVAIEADPKTDPGAVVFFDTDGGFISSVTVGALPDMITFTPDGNMVLTANEGEPNGDYDIDPNGTVSIVDISGGVANVTNDDVTTVDFTAFNDTELDEYIRIFGPGASVAQDMEPEFIAVSEDSKMAWVVCQENNALAFLDLETKAFTAVKSFGVKDHSQEGNGLDASNRDDAINITTWPVWGFYMPDGIASYTVNSSTYLVTANEGDARDYDEYSEEERIADLTLDPTVFPNASELQMDENLGRLNSTTANGDTDDDGDVDQLFSYGARSFTIWDADGNLVWDSGDEFEQITANLLPGEFNSTNDENETFDNRSDDKGPEPEGVVVGMFKGKYYAFIGLERISGIMVYDVTDPAAPVFVQYVSNRNFSGNAEEGTAGDLGPEGLAFVRRNDSPIDNPILAVGNEVSGSTTIYEIREVSTSAPNEGATEDVTLGQNIPNPFASGTDIPFTIGNDAHVTITVLDINGRVIGTPVDGRYAAGKHSVRFTATEALPAGRYFYRLMVDGNVVSVRSLALVR